MVCDIVWRINKGVGQSEDCLAPFLFYRKLPSGATITGCHLTGGVRHRKNKGGDCYEKENGKCNAGVDDGTGFWGCKRLCGRRSCD